MQRLVAVLVIAMLGIGGATAFVLWDRGDDPAPPPGPRPAPEVTLLAGSATNVALLPSLLEPIAVPVTIEALDRGAGSARLTNVLVGGRVESIAWPGGTPIELTALDGGAGELSLDPVSVEADPGGLVVSLGGVSGTLTPGRYRVSGPVALGGEGLARPADTVDFEATPDTVVAFAGGALLRLPAASRTLEGPGSVVVVGDVEITTTDRDRRVGLVEFGEGPYRVDLVWVGDHLEIDGVFEGPLRTAQTPTSTSS